MTMKHLKYGIGILTPAAPAGADFGVSAESSRPAIDAGHDDVLVLSFEDAMRHDCAAPYLLRLMASHPSEDPVFAWHDAHAKQGIVVVVPPDFRGEKPIRITFPSVKGTNAANVVIVAGAGSVFRIIESADPVSWARPEAFTRSARVDLMLENDAVVEYVSVQDLGPGASDFIRRRARLGEDARLAWTDFCFGSGFSRSSVVTRLEGENASVTSRGVYFGRGRQQYDFQQEVLHLAPRTRSDLKIRGVLKDRSKAIVRGLVRIEKNAHGCSGFQKEDALLLSEGAEADAVPKLEIENDDVKCGHAASTGRIDEEKLFYLMSRGIDRKTATAAIVEGFLSPIVAEAKDAMLEESLERAIRQRLED